MKIKQGTKVLITGGASGIGKLMGQIVLQKGAELIIWDISQEKINATIAELSGSGKVYGYRVDVSNSEQVSQAAAAVKKEHGTVDLLINNAGIVVGKLFHEHTLPDINRTMDINSLAPMITAWHFLPEMVKQRSGHICNIASSAGLTSNPRMAVYVASKWAVTGWSDSLRIEMDQMKTNVGITTVTPYYINTGMFDGVRSPFVPILEPRKVAGKIIKGIEKNRRFVSMPWSVHFVRLSQGILPFGAYDWLVGKVMGIYKTMDHFKGHQN